MIQKYLCLLGILWGVASSAGLNELQKSSFQEAHRFLLSARQWSNRRDSEKEIQSLLGRLATKKKSEALTPFVQAAECALKQCVSDHQSLEVLKTLLEMEPEIYVNAKLRIISDHRRGKKKHF